MSAQRRPSQRLPLADERGNVAAQTLAFGVLVIVLLVGVAALVAMSSLEPTPEELPATSVPPTFQEVRPVGSLDLTCGDGTAGVRVAAVNARAYGVHVAVTGVQGQRVVFQSDTGIGYELLLRGEATNAVLPLPPGVWHGACTAADGPPPQPDAGAAFVIFGPRVPFRAEHAGVHRRRYRRDRSPSPAFSSSPKAAIREVLSDDGVTGSDVIERAAYPKSVSSVDPVNPLVFRVLREDVIVAHVDAVQSDDGWSYHVSGCLAQS